MKATPVFPLEGGCDCRHVRYRMETAPLFVHCCHCRWCQRESGASFALNAMIEADRVTVLGAEPELVDTPSASGYGQKFARCPRCRIALWSNYAGAGPLIRFVRVGTLDLPDHLPPDIHIFTASKQPWVVIPPGTPAVLEYYEREKHWPAESLARRQALLPGIEQHQARLRTRRAQVYATMIRRERLSATVEGSLVVFLIGMRVNKPWKVHRWWPVAQAMPRMLAELQARPELGMLGGEMWFGRTTILVQYWRTLEQLLAYAKDRNAMHLPAWRAFNQSVGSSGDVGVWHETYSVPAGAYENIYVNMPAFGLGRFGKLTPATGVLQSAEGRLRAGDRSTP